MNRVARKPVFGFFPLGPTNQAVQPQKMTKGLKFQVKEVEDMYVAKSKALISLGLTMQLICAFVSAYAKSRFSHDAAHLIEI